MPSRAVHCASPGAFTATRRPWPSSGLAASSLTRERCSAARSLRVTAWRPALRRSRTLRLTPGASGRNADEDAIIGDPRPCSSPARAAPRLAPLMADATAPLPASASVPHGRSAAGILPAGALVGDGVRDSASDGPAAQRSPGAFDPPKRREPTGDPAPNRPLPPGLVLASDGLPARDNGPWAQHKHAFLEHFGPPALQATRSMRRRVYLDLFAGPGLNVARPATGSPRPGPDPAHEFDGSPLLALELHGARDEHLTFTDAVFVNHSAHDHAALAARVDRRCAQGRSRIPRTRIETRHGDTNACLPDILSTIDPRTYVFAFADMEAPRQCPWRTIAQLRARHRSVDLYLLFPLDMALKRLVDYSGAETHAAVLTEFFGTDAWRGLRPLRQSNALRHDLGRGLEALYLQQLRTRWRYADVVSEVRRGTHHKLYKMLFASDHPAGEKLARWAKRRTEQDATPQLGLGV